MFEDTKGVMRSRQYMDRQYHLTPRIRKNRDIYNSWIFIVIMHCYLFAIKDMCMRKTHGQDMCLRTRHVYMDKTCVYGQDMCIRTRHMYTYNTCVYRQYMYSRTRHVYTDNTFRIFCPMPLYISYDKNDVYGVSISIQ